MPGGCRVGSVVVGFVGILVIVLIERDAVLFGKRSVLVVLSTLPVAIATKAQVECAGTCLLELSRFFEAAVTTLLHGRAPEPRELTLIAILPAPTGDRRAYLTPTTHSRPRWQNWPMGSIVALLNQKGGVGKTTVTLGLASAAAHAGHRVLVVDLDPQASATWVLGIDPDTVHLSTADVLFHTRAADAIIASPWSESIDVLPGSTDLQSRESGSPSRLRTALADVADRYHALLLDCPPSLGNLTTSGLTAADHAVIVVEPSALGLRGIGAVADLIDDVWDAHNGELELSGVIVNRVPAVSGEADRRTAELARIVGKKAIWKPAIPQRVIFNQAIGERRSIHSFGFRSAEVSYVFDQLWAKMRRTVN